MNALNLTTGKIDWTWTRGSAGYNTPYGIYPNWVFGTQSIADGMLFISEGRCYDPPLFPGGEKIALNCATGKLVWEINGAFQRDVSPIADGELMGWNGYDGQIYGFGLGPSKTTITAPNPSQLQEPQSFSQVQSPTSLQAQAKKQLQQTSPTAYHAYPTQA